MKKNTSRTLTTFVVSIVIFAIATALLFYLACAAFVFNTDMYLAEIEHENVITYLAGHTTSWGVTKAGIIAKYADGPWAYQVVSGNVNMVVTILLIFSLIATCCVSYLLAKMSYKILKKRASNVKVMAKAKANCKVAA